MCNNSITLWPTFDCFIYQLNYILLRKEGQQAMNRDEGSYQLSHAYDRFLDTASSCRVKNRKN